ncbi:hypothetical protein BpHYR1_044703 [Brachionus plicatilis]|uniref:Uncharacterized protein n=1 Tax=Brachionus plicatilis TaxID=10195 RepID=A0A3M7PMK7_BRAPC|nr:hypothetical protein BpHYR1_044703 [Brachionus plicatilis]
MIYDTVVKLNETENSISYVNRAFLNFRKKPTACTNISIKKITFLDHDHFQFPNLIQHKFICSDEKIFIKNDSLISLKMAILNHNKNDTLKPNWNILQKDKI